VSERSERTSEVRFTFDDREVGCADGATVGAALVAVGVRSWRTTRNEQRPRGIFCAIGVCFDCLVTINGRPSVRACLARARAGDDVRTGRDAGRGTTPSGVREGAVAPSPAASGQLAGPPLQVSAAKPLHQTRPNGESGAQRSERVRAKPANFDVAVVGGGPAGLAAAAVAAESGTRVVLLDAGGAVGGQFWRSGSSRTEHLLHGRTQFRDLRRRLTASGVRILVRHDVVTIWRTGSSWSLRCVSSGDDPVVERPVIVTASNVILATGAIDRQLPFPGWDLPGVMSAGGVQALLKGSGVVAGRSVVVAGTGPFLLPVSADLVRMGGRVPAVVEASSPATLLRHPRALVGSAAKGAEGAGYLWRLRRAGTPYLRRHVVVRAIGETDVEAVEVARVGPDGRRLPGTERTFECDVLAVGWGFVPQLELQAGCATSLGGDGTLIVDVDADQRTSVDGVWAAGEATGVGGSDLALVEGEIAGHTVAGRTPPRSLLRRRASRRRFAAALHAAFPVRVAFVEEVAADAVLCRCEEVTVGAVRDAVELWGATDARTAKMLTRTGMGWCQGRVCGVACASIVAHACGRAPTAADLRAFAERPFATPVSLGLLAEPD
jgi:thioredoxin reductase